MTEQILASPLLKITLIFLILFGNIQSCRKLTSTTSNVTPPLTITPSEISYYVNTAVGLDTNPGTQTLPWRTIQKAATTAPIGSTITVLAGNYAERVNISRAITLQGQGQVVTQGFTVQADFVTIDGFEISNKSLDTTNGWGIYLTGNNNMIANNYIHDTTWGGIMLFASIANPSLSNSNIVQGNRIVHVGEIGIDVRGRNNVIGYNDISGVMQYPAWLTNPPTWADADGIHFHGSGHIIRGNYIHDILYTVPENIDPHIDCFQTFASSPSQEPASNILFEQNRCDNARVQTTGEVGKGFMIAGASNITIRNNIIKAYAGINAGAGSNQLTILNNTIIGNLSLPITFDPVGLDFTNVPVSVVKNNIFYNMPGHSIYLQDTISQNGMTSGKNIMYRSDGKALWTTNTYSHINDLWGINPLLTVDYHLLPSSPAIDVGYVVPVSNDFDGNLRPLGAGYDIGAFEFWQ
jgi:parallel beta-helix repeat protein